LIRSSKGYGKVAAIRNRDASECSGLNYIMPFIFSKMTTAPEDAGAWPASDTDDMMMRRSAIFDLDGTLTDSKPGILGCLTNALQAHGVAWSGPLDWFIGPPADDSLRRLMPDADEHSRAALLHDYRLCYDATGWEENSVYPGVHTLLQSLQTSGWQLFVCTSKREDFAARILEKFALKRYFLALYADTAESLHHTKTALLRRLLDEQSLDLATTFMVGDRNFDIEAARANGVASIAVTYGYGTPEELESACPDHICNAVEDLLPIFSAHSQYG
jgi:phosphoglycolate phosphatase